MIDWRALPAVFVPARGIERCPAPPDAQVTQAAARTLPPSSMRYRIPHVSAGSGRRRGATTAWSPIAIPRRYLPGSPRSASRSPLIRSASNAAGSPGPRRATTLTHLRFFWKRPRALSRPAGSGTRASTSSFHRHDHRRALHRNELSSVDTTLLLMGVLFATILRPGVDAKEREISARPRAETPCPRRLEFLPHRWPRPYRWAGPERGLPIPGQLDVLSNEGMFVYIPGLAAPNIRCRRTAGEVWIASHPGTAGAARARHVTSPSRRRQPPVQPYLIDFRGIRDKVMREAGMDYFENLRHHLCQPFHCIANPRVGRLVQGDIWGLRL